jgi:hypothetical protein
MKSDVLEKYRKIQEKYELPQFNELTAAFKVDSENFEDIDTLRVEISDQLFSFSERVIEHIMTGDQAFCCMFEQDMVTTEERKNMFELYKKIQVLKWENNLLMIKPDEKKTSEWIRKTWNLWHNDLEKEMLKMCTKLSACWSDLKFKSDKITYMG